MSPIEELLFTNGKWAETVDEAEPGFFEYCTKGQSPKVLWIGCADSRVPESVITGSKPGEIFVHRNIANQFHLEDDSALSVLSYAVEFVGVEHVVLAGHSHCGGAAACYQAVQKAATDPHAPSAADSALGRWLAPLTDMIGKLDLSDKKPSEALDYIVEENVKMQVENICKSEPIKSAWARSGGKEVWVHGWVYDIGTGRIRDLKVSRGPPSA
ncbi:carbonic anhydrase [Melanogaster broomeanus]|nr:carbonic anhydrase [Melanogaster broomeanus]